MVLSCRGVGFGRSMLVIRNVSVDSVCLGDFKGKGHMGSWSFWSAGLWWWWWWGGAEKKRCRAHGALGKLGPAGAHRSDQASVSPALYRGVTPPGRLVVSQQQHDDQHPLAPPPRADGGRDEGSRDAPCLCRPLLPRPEAQGAQTQVNCWIVIKDQ